MHMACCYRVNGVHLTASPPFYTSKICTTTVMAMMTKNIGLLKKSANTLNSLSPIFLQLISLNTCMKMNVLKMKV